MVLKTEQERIKTLLKDTITLLCRNGLTFKTEFSIEALIGITLDRDDVMLVSINDLIRTEAGEKLAADELARERSVSADEDEADEGMSGNVIRSLPSRRPRKRLRPSVHKNNEKQETCSDQEQSQNNTLEESSPSHPEPLSKKSAVSNIDRPIKHEETDVDDEEDIVFVKQENESSYWPEISRSPDSFPASFDTEPHQSTSQQEGLDFLQNSSLVPVGAQGDGNFPMDAAGGSGQNSLSRRMFPSTSDQDRTDSQGVYDISCQIPERNILRGSSKSKKYRNTGRDGTPSGDERPKKANFQCDTCFKYYNSRTSLRLHIATQHEGKFPHICVLCGKGFAHKNNLQGHMVRHTSIPEFTCEWCGQSFSYKQNWRRHVKGVHPQHL